LLPFSAARRSTDVIPLKSAVCGVVTVIVMVTLLSIKLPLKVIGPCFDSLLVRTPESPRLTFTAGMKTLSRVSGAPFPVHAEGVPQTSVWRYETLLSSISA